MLDTLRAWLNGSREYYTGVALYAAVGGNTALLELFKKGQTAYTYQRLQEELLIICNNLKQKQNGEISNLHSSTFTSKRGQQTESCSYEHRQTSPANKKYVPAETSESPNPELYAVAKVEADKSYKEVMNLRAELFALARVDDFTDPNTPIKIQSREKLAVNVVVGFQKVSQLYDKADYVKLHGRLPNQEDEDTNDYDALPDHLVKQTLDNLRKNVNKMKRREQTPERVALIQKHESNIEKLKNRWLLLRPTK